MKKSIKFSIVAALLMSFATVSAKDLEKVLKDKEKITVVNFSKLKKGTEIKIKDTNGVSLYQESVEKTGAYSKSFDLSKLPDGTYFIEVNTQSQLTIMPFKISDDQVNMEKALEYVIHKPILLTKNNKVTLTKLSLDQNPLEVKVYYQDGVMVYSEKIANKTSIAKMFDFSEAQKGTYTFVMKSDGRVFQEDINF